MGRAAPERRRLFDLAIVEGDPLALTSLYEVFSAQPSIRSVLVYSCPAQALREIPKLRPEVVLTDLWLSKSNVVDLARQFTAQCPASKVLIYSVCRDPQMIHEAVAAGVSGYLLKPASATELTDAVQTVASGQFYFPVAILEQLIRAIQAQAQVWNGLPISPQQLRIVRLYMQNFTYQEIGDKLHISPATVDTQLKRIREKLHAHTRPALLKRITCLLHPNSWPSGKVQWRKNAPA